FPCPRPLTEPAEVDGQTVTAEEFVNDGEYLLGTAATASKFAAPLARLVDLCRDYSLSGTLEPAPPWLGGWEHDDARPWPTPDDLDVDLNLFPDPAWLTDIATSVGGMLRECRLPKVIGHVDWHPGNFGWREGALHVVHDWDSLALLPEAA